MDRPSHGQRGVGFGDGHLVVGEVGAPMPVVGLKNQFAPVADQHAVRVAHFFILGRAGDLRSVGLHQGAIAAVHAQLPNGEPIFPVLRGRADVGLFQVGQLGLQRVEVVLGVEDGDLGSQAIADFGPCGDGEKKRKGDREGACVCKCLHGDRGLFIVSVIF